MEGVRHILGPTGQVKSRDMFGVMDLHVPLFPVPIVCCNIPPKFFFFFSKRAVLVDASANLEHLEAEGGMYFFIPPVRHGCFLNEMVLLLCCWPVVVGSLVDLSRGNRWHHDGEDRLGGKHTLRQILKKKHISS